ncbi:MAG: single-stranded DNA-binding protein, partial [Phycisphaerae bacterium]|nr:single-stranded DNA-binding protein [Phycisphaerae bacterium]
ILMGNLTRDPQLRYLPNNTAVCEFGMAVNRRWRDRDGNQKEEVCFVDLTAFGRQGETINQYMAKGRPMLVEGRLRYESWTGQDGQKRSRLGVVVENFTFVGSRDGNRGDGGGAGGGEYRQQRSSGPQSYDDGPPMSDGPPVSDAPPPSGDDIPF